jgi:hypothetical protein
MIRERVKTGLERTRAKGKTLRRSPSAWRPPLSSKKGDIGIRKIATTLGVGTGTV